MIAKVQLGLVLAFLTTLVHATSLPAKTIYQLPADRNPSWLECVLVTDNGDLLLTTVAPNPSIYTLSRPWDAEPKITSNITLPGLDGALGLADLGGNKYAVAAAKFQDHWNFIDNSSEIWVVDLSNPKKPTHRHVVSIPAAGELNDMVVLNATGGAKDILLADSKMGLIWKVSMDTGAYSVWLESPTMGIPINSTERWPFGINGLRYGTDGSLYFTNTNTRIIWNIKIMPDGSASPDVEYVHEVCGAAALDNLAVDKDNRLWIASNRDNKLILVERHGSTWKSKVVLGGDTEHIIAGDTAVAFGRTAKEASTLYVVTSGANGWPVPPNGFTEPAKVVQVDVSAYLS